MESNIGLLPDTTDDASHFHVSNYFLLTPDIGRFSCDKSFRKFFDCAAQGLAITDLDGRLVDVNLALQSMFGYSRKELLRSGLLPLTHEDDAAAKIPLDALTKGEIQSYQVERRYIKNDGSVFWCRINAFLLPDRQCEASFLVKQFQDISPHKHAEEQLYLAARVINQSGEGIVILDENAHILTINKAFTKITGYTLDEVAGRTPSMLQSGKYDALFYEQIRHRLNREGFWQGAVTYRHKGGALYEEWLTINTVLSKGKVINYVAVLNDSREIKDSRRCIEFLATHDFLTELPNRYLFTNRLEQAIAHAKRHTQTLALLFVDLDNFKSVNDSAGHAAGDAVLKGVVQRLKACVRDDDTVARLGGDEFAVLLESIAANRVAMIAQRIIDALAAPFSINTTTFFISASIGAASFPDDGDSAEILLKNADTAMYQAKAHGKNNIQYFHRDMDQRSQERLKHEQMLRKALEDNAFKLVYQPQINLSDLSFAGVEALIRLELPNEGVISPAFFIPIAEQCGLIDKIDAWVFEEAFRQLSEWQGCGKPPPRVSINLSPRHLRKTDVPDLLKRLLQTYAVDPALVGIEFTETTLLENSQALKTMLDEIKSMGFHLILDDFGTGYSSLSYLKHYPIDEVKIDASFVRDITTDPEDKAITFAIIALCKQLGLRCVVEGVENEVQLAMLREGGCPLVQGYYFYRPLPAAEIASLL